MKKILMSLFLLGLSLAILLPFLTGGYAVLPEQAMRRQEKAYLLKDTEILLKMPGNPFSMDFNPEYFFVTRDDAHYYFSHIRGKMAYNNKRLGHYVPAADLRCQPRGQFLSVLPLSILEYKTTEEQRAKTGIYIGDCLPIFVCDEELRGDHIRASIQSVFQSSSAFHNLNGLGVALSAETDLDENGFGILYFNDHDFIPNDVNAAENLPDNYTTWYTVLYLLRGISDRKYTFHLELELLKDGQLVHLETLTVSP